nr:unnamed protein product [Callosobruchus analis]
MTRYARAKGSKASNEKLPEEPTSWSIMKQQLLEKTRNMYEKQDYLKIKHQRNASYQKFLVEREAEENKNIKWADFPDGGTFETSKNNREKKFKKPPKEIVANKLSDDDGDDSDEDFLELKAKIDKVLEEQKDVNNSDEEHSSKIETKQPIVPKAKKVKVKKLKIVTNKESKVIAKKDQAIQSAGHLEKSKTSGKNNIRNNAVDTSNRENKHKKMKNIVNETSTVSNSLYNEEILSESALKRIQKKKERRLKQVKKKQALKLQRQNDRNIKNDGENEDKGDMIQTKKECIKKPDKSNISEEELKRIQKKKEKKLRQLEKKKLNKKMEKEKKESEGEDGDHKNKNHNSSDNKNISSSKSKSLNKEKKASVPKKRKDKSTENDHQRKKLHLPEKMWINGEQVEIDYVDGFPVMKKDAERLKQLKKDMVMKGLPGSEIKSALKLERRRAEKALAREKKKVCFNCRKAGHNLSECPELGKDQIISTAGSGICFKCGSTEHSHLNCKVVKGQSFNYAQCFICGEQGHIARQCPDNPKGLYPKGGGCNVCGDVSHLKKDCPTYQEQQQHQNETIKLGTLGTNNPDADDEHDITHKVKVTNSDRPNKIIKF